MRGKGEKEWERYDTDRKGRRGGERRKERWKG
jgi:hypothetical protein